MDESQEDQRAPHRQRPNRAVSLEQLRRLGVVYRRVRRGVQQGTAVGTEGTAGCAGPGRPQEGRQGEAGGGRRPVSLWQLRPPRTPGTPRDSHGGPEFRLLQWPLNNFFFFFFPCLFF